MISISDYFGKYGKDHKDVTPACYANAQRLLIKVNSLMAIAMANGIEFPVNPKTGSQISGDANGGFRPQDCPIGATGSAHKRCMAIDIYDPKGDIDHWLNHTPEAREAIKDLDMYFEAMSATVGWSHWSILKPASGNRFFFP